MGVGQSTCDLEDARDKIEKQSLDKGVQSVSDRPAVGT